MVLTQEARREIATNEQHWMWKAGLRIITIIVCLIGIGTVAGSAEYERGGSKYVADGMYDYYGYSYFSFYYIIWATIPLGMSILWNFCVVCVLFTRKRPVHPGANVGVDLVLWMAFISLGTFVIIGAADAVGYESYWYEDANSIKKRQNYSGTPDSIDIDKPCARFDGCDNARRYADMMAERGRILTTGAVCCMLAVLLHFILFVWACVDTARHNRMRATRDAEFMAEQLIRRFRETGHWGPYDAAHANQQNPPPPPPSYPSAAHSPGQPIQVQPTPPAAGMTPEQKNEMVQRYG